MRRRAGPADGFSIVEIVLGLTIMSVLLGVTVTTYRDSVGQVREQLARDEMRAIRSAIQRWQLDHRRPYPFESVLPLVPEYLRNVKKDPWGGVFVIDQAGKRIISTGPDGGPGYASVPGDQFGEGDDVVEFFDTTSDVAPGPPQNLTVRLDNANIVVDFDPPLRDRDGSSPVDDLVRYVVEIRSASSIEVREWLPNVPAGVYNPSTKTYPDIPIGDRTRLKSDVGVVFPAGPGDPDPEDQSYYFTVRAVDAAGNRSLPSNQAGLFVAKEVGPRIVTFHPSSPTPAVSSPFSFFIEVTDADSNLDRVELRGFGSTIAWTTQAADPFKIANPFRFIRNYAPAPALLATTGDFPGVYLFAVDKSGTTTQTDPVNIEVVNNPPRVTALTPGIQLLTVNPSATLPVHVDFTFEANDADANLSQMTFTWWDKDLGTALYERDFDLNPPGSIMVRTTGLDFDITAPHDYEIRVVATDQEGAKSVVNKARVLVKEDTTPPDALATSLDPSNDLLSTQPFLGWFVTTDTELKVHLEAFEIESPPIIYEIKITTAALAADGAVPPNDMDNADPLNAGPVSIPGHDFSTHVGWLQIEEADLDPNGDIVISRGNGLLDEDLQEHVPYYLGMRAINSSGITNFTTTVPLHQLSFERQYPFRLDKSPPLIEEVAIEGKLIGGTTWITNLFDAEWTVSDPVGRVPGNPIGSGPDRYRYRITRATAGVALPAGFIDHVQDWQEVATLELNSIPLPASDPSTDNGLDIHLEVHARDRAGNWTTVPGSSVARIDFTSPESVVPPLITNQSAGIISVLDTFSASWGPPLPGFAFQDLESGIESWEWGVATTDLFVGFPDIFGWQPVQSGITSATVSQNNLLVNGDRVHAVVRARNFAGSVSPFRASTSAIVDASLFTSLTAFPAAGISPLSVDFTATVTGGVPPYDVTFQFDGTNLRQYSVNTSAGVITTDYTYDLLFDEVTGDATLPRPEIIARLIVVDTQGRESRKDFIVDVREDVMLAMGVKGAGGAPNGAIQIASMDGAGSITELATLSASFGGGTTVPVVQALGVEPRGAFAVVVAGDSNQVRWVDLTTPKGPRFRPVIDTIAGIANSTQRADGNSFVFKPNIPEGLLLQTFQPPDQAFENNAPGFLRVVRFGAIGSRGTNRFGFVTGTTKEYYAAAPSADFPDRGLVVQNEFVGFDQWSARTLSSLDSAAARVDSFESFASGSFGTLLSSKLAGLIRDTGETRGTALPEFGARAAPSRQGSWFLTQARPGLPPAQQGIVRVTPGGGGIGSISLIPFSGGQVERPTGLIDMTEDGSVYVFAAGSPVQWELGFGKANENTFTMSTDGLTTIVDALEIKNLAVDPGGTQVVITAEHTSAGVGSTIRVADIEVNGSPPSIEHKSGVVDYSADGRLGGVAANEFAAPVEIADTRIFRRPANGAPILQDVFSERDVGAAGAPDNGIPLDSNPIPQDDESILLRGINMDRVQRVVVRHLGTSTEQTITALDRTGLPPVGPYDPSGTVKHIPAGGNRYHFLKIAFPATVAADIGFGLQDDIEFTLETDAGASVLRSSYTTKILGN